ncbi:hypothetical protein MLD38_000570 [Melastoma candidum]|uniref:Uncharacterized protein n=1 Tax=Melastoma candidum TaxID=119954 RepID=A0ACB9SJ48_9MYRT|nr:hypothetical protein MLD38_000570 [Melastoma candidum]
MKKREIAVTLEDEVKVREPTSSSPSRQRETHSRTSSRVGVCLGIQSPQLTVYSSPARETVWNKSSREVRFILVGEGVIRGAFRGEHGRGEEIDEVIYDYENRISGFEKAIPWR